MMWDLAALPRLFLSLISAHSKDTLGSISNLLLPHFYTHGFCLCESEPPGLTQIDTLWSGLSARWQMLPSSWNLFPGPDMELVPRCLGAEPGWSLSWTASGCLAGHGRQLSASDELRLSLWSGVAELSTVADLLTWFTCCAVLGELAALCMWCRSTAWGHILYSAFPP